MKKNEGLVCLRVLAVISVVVGHLAADTNFMLGLFKVIYSYHIPLFVFISGYCFFYSMTHLNSIKDVVASKSVRLLFTLWMGRLFAILPEHLFLYKDVPWDINAILQYIAHDMPNEHLWYLQTLFIIMVIMYPFCKLSKKYKYLNVIVLFILAINFNYFGGLVAYHLELNYSFYFMLGFSVPNIIEPLYEKDGLHKVLKGWKNLLCIITTGIMVYGQYLIQCHFETYYGAWNLAAHRNRFLLVSTLTIIWLYMMVSVVLSPKIVTKIAQNKVVRLIDRYSLTIYIYHIIISNILALLIVDPVFTLFPKIHLIRIARKVVGVLAMIFGPIAVNLGLDATIEKLKKYRKDKIVAQDDNQ